MAGGYTGKYSIIDLGSGNIEIVEPGDDFYRNYLSGYGLGAAVIMERQIPGLDPLSPDSYLGICSGLLTGTGARFSEEDSFVGTLPILKRAAAEWLPAHVVESRNHRRNDEEQEQARDTEDGR